MSYLSKFTWFSIVFSAAVFRKSPALTYWSDTFGISIPEDWNAPYFKNPNNSGQARTSPITTTIVQIELSQILAEMVGEPDLKEADCPKLKDPGRLFQSPGG